MAYALVRTHMHTRTYTHVQLLPELFQFCGTPDLTQAIIHAKHIVYYQPISPVCLLEHFLCIYRYTHAFVCPHRQSVAVKRMSGVWYLLLCSSFLFSSVSQSFSVSSASALL